MWKDHRCYGYVINWPAFRSSKKFSEMIWYFIGCYLIIMIEQSWHDHLEIYMKFLFSSWQNISIFKTKTKRKYYKQILCSIQLCS